MRNKIYLRMVTDLNNNKDYLMEDNQNGTFTVQWGRFGCEKMQSQTYPIYQWDKKLNEKLNKGYRDVTQLGSKINNKRGAFKPIGNVKMDNLFNRLLSISNLQIANNYQSQVEDVTQSQINESQAIIDSLSRLKMGPNVNENLIDLFHILPRKMKDVKSYLWDGASALSFIIQREQDLLDTLSAQVGVQVSSNKLDDTILDTMGISVSDCNAHDIKIIQSMMGNARQRIVSAFRVSHAQQKQDYETHRTQVRKDMLLWHGSRSQNWIGILKEGLRIRPSNAVMTGAMWGSGIYFADKFQKSLGYTSLSGSYWSNGVDDLGYLGIFNVNMGKVLIAEKHAQWAQAMDYDKIQKRGYDSLHATAGYDLRNPEFIIYHPHQCVIQYVVEVS